MNWFHTFRGSVKRKNKFYIQDNISSKKKVSEIDVDDIVLLNNRVCIVTNADILGNKILLTGKRIDEYEIEAELFPRNLRIGYGNLRNDSKITESYQPTNETLHQREETNRSVNTSSEKMYTVFSNFFEEMSDEELSNFSMTSSTDSDLMDL